MWAVGDAAGGRPAAREVGRLISRGPRDRLAYLGDVYETGTAEEYERNYAPVFGSLAPRTIPTPGNHEWPNRAEGYDAYWSRVFGRSQPPWFSMRLGGWQILSLNSEAEHAPGSPQLSWLHGQLAEPGDCRLAIWHRPRWSAGRRHGDQPDVAPLWDALPGRARVVVNAHEHDMQRFRPIDGITQLVSGAGGQGLYRIDRPDRRLAFADDEQYGALRMELRPGSLSFSFIAVDGRVLDSGRVACRQAK